jgi:BlaI family transcriptional regulator, penicillinase repressor
LSESPPNLTERDLDVLNILWRRGSGTVAEVREELPETVGYTGVLKLLQILEEKGMVRHEQEGRAYRYYPTLEPDEAGAPALRRLVDRLFQGSVELALARLVSGRKLEPAEVERMKKLLDEAEQGRRGLGKEGGKEGGKK